MYRTEDTDQGALKKRILLLMFFSFLTQNLNPTGLERKLETLLVRLCENGLGPLYTIQIY